MSLVSNRNSGNNANNGSQSGRNKMTGDKMIGDKMTRDGLTRDRLTRGISVGDGGSLPPPCGSAESPSAGVDVTPLSSSLKSYSNINGTITGINLGSINHGGIINSGAIGDDKNPLAASISAGRAIFSQSLSKMVPEIKESFLPKYGPGGIPLSFVNSSCGLSGGQIMIDTSSSGPTTGLTVSGSRTSSSKSPGSGIFTSGIGSLIVGNHGVSDPVVESVTVQGGEEDEDGNVFPVNLEKKSTQEPVGAMEIAI